MAAAYCNSFSEYLEHLLRKACPPQAITCPDRRGDEALTAEIKIRVQPSIKKAFEEIAGTRHLDTADIVREALREYLAKNPPTQSA